MVGRCSCLFFSTCWCRKWLDVVPENWYALSDSSHTSRCRATRQVSTCGDTCSWCHPFCPVRHLSQSTHLGCTGWVKVESASTLERHPVSLNSANPIFREAQDRRHSSPNPEYHFNNDVPNRLREQRRLSILSWNPGPPTAERRCHREPHRGEMAHHCSAGGKRVPRARILDESLLCDSLWMLCCLVQ